LLSSPLDHEHDDDGARTGWSRNTTTAGTRFMSITNHEHYRAPHYHDLDDLVQPGQADTICMVVSTLAKIYAQRLVTTACSIAKKQQQQQQANFLGSKGVYGNMDPIEPLQPQHIAAAYRLRQQQGLDPGFFLPPVWNSHDNNRNSSSACYPYSSGCGIDLSCFTGMIALDHYRHLAARASQEEFDQHFPNPIQELMSVSPEPIAEITDSVVAPDGSEMDQET
jgi:hypothetical protein